MNNVDEGVFLKFAEKAIEQATALSDICKEPFKVITYKEVLRKALSFFPSPIAASLPAIEGTGLSLDSEGGDLPSPLRHWLSRNDIPEALIHTLFAFKDSGEIEIIARFRPRSKRDGQVTLAYLVAVKNLATKGKCVIPRQELIALCKTFAIHDSANFAQYMSKLRLSFGTRDTSSDSWMLTRPGEDKAAEVIKNLLNK